MKWEQDKQQAIWDARDRRRADEALAALREKLGPAEEKQDRKPRGKYREGTKVLVSYYAYVTDGEPGDGWLPLKRIASHTTARNQPWYEWEAAVTIEVVPPDITPGTILTAGGVTWVARRSNRRDSLRIMPVDLSGKLRTMPIEEFFTRYQAAKIRYAPDSGEVSQDSD